MLGVVTFFLVVNSLKVIDSKQNPIVQIETKVEKSIKPPSVEICTSSFANISSLSVRMGRANTTNGIPNGGIYEMVTYDYVEFTKGNEIVAVTYLLNRF